MREGIGMAGWVLGAAALVLWIGSGCDPAKSPDSAQAEHEEHSEEHPEEKSSGEHPEEKGEEHPEEKGAEHPEEGEKPGEHEHPDEEGEGEEHPDEAAAETEPVTLADVADEIERYVASEGEENGGRFSFRDEKADETLSLELTQVHRERLANLGDGKYFVCADFETPEGKLYDLDFFVKQEGNALRVTDVMLHKEAGDPRYTWYEDEGVWKRRAVADG